MCDPYELLEVMPENVLCARNLTASMKLIYSYIARDLLANPKLANCPDTNAKIALRLGLSVNGVSHAINVLKKLGYIQASVVHIGFKVRRLLRPNTTMFHLRALKLGKSF